MPFSDKPQIIRKSNELITARYKLNLAEQRLVLLLASEITPDDEDFKSYEIRIADFAKMFDLEKCKAMYSEIEKAAESLLNQTIVLQDNETKEMTNWLSYVKYVKGSGVISLEFHKSLKPYLLQLKSHFTQYQTNYVIDFKSQYSIRLYELLKMDAFKANKNGQFEKHFEVSKLRLTLGVDKKDYALFADFRRFVIQPATREISDKTDLCVDDIQYGKTGRAITNMNFFVSVRSEEETKLRQDNLRIEDIKPAKESDNHAVIDSLISLGFSLEIAKRCKNKYGVKHIERNIAYTLAKKQAGLVKDIPAYLNKAIENDYGGAWELEKKKDEERKKEVKQKADTLEREQKEKAEKKLKEASERTEKIFNAFYLFSLEKQNTIKNEFFSFIKENDNATFNCWLKAEKDNKNPIETIIVKRIFLKFLVDNKICVV